MKVDQTIFAEDPKKLGNCVAACVATLLDLPLEQVPHFVEFGVFYGDSTDVHDVSAGAHWWAMLLGFMAAKGFWPVELESVTDGEPGEILFVAGKSPRGVSHQVLYRGGVLWHDPHPSRAGVLTGDRGRRLAPDHLLRPRPHTDSRLHHGDGRRVYRLSAAPA